MKRRDFLKTGGIVGTAGLILDGCGKPQQLIPLLVSEDQFVPGEEGWVRALCQQCSAGCGITVRVMQGESIRTIDGQQKRVKAVQAKKIEGNPEHPISMGGTCARGQAGVQVLYHPDRFNAAQAVGTAGLRPVSGHHLERSAAASRDTASAAAGRPAGDRHADRPQKPRHDGRRRRTIRRGPRHLECRFVRSVRPGADSQGDGVLTGSARLPAVDFGNANYLLSFNANLFETFLSPVRNIYAYGQMRQGRPGIRGKFVQAEPRLSQTAACADEWLPIRPGTEGLLALAIAHVIVSEKLYDAEFVGKNTSGFAEWSASLAEYAAEKVAPQIDVPAASIQRVAREFASRRPSVAVGDSRDVASLTAIYALNALVGAYGRPGGILFGADEVSDLCLRRQSLRPAHALHPLHPCTRYPHPHRIRSAAAKSRHCSCSTRIRSSRCRRRRSCARRSRTCRSSPASRRSWTRRLSWPT